MQKGRVERFSLAVEKYVPDAITSAVFMVIILFVFTTSIGIPLSKTTEAYYKGLWLLLSFTMQMTLIITLSAVFGSSPLFRRAIRALATIPQSPFQVIVLATLFTAILGYFYWGLAITLGPVIAIYFCGEAERKGIKVDFLLCLAVVFAAHSVWQYGLSSSPALTSRHSGSFPGEDHGKDALINHHMESRSDSSSCRFHNHITCYRLVFLCLRFPRPLPSFLIPIS